MACAGRITSGCAVALLLALFACSEDDPASGPSGAAGEAGGTGGGGAGGVSGAGGGAGGASGAGGGAGSGGGGGASGSGGAPACEEQPCKLVLPQCGCAEGEACTVLGGERLCATAGTVGAGLECNATDGCQPGYACLNLDGYSPTCVRFCAGSADCEAPGGTCLDRDYGGVCTQSCDPLAGTGCAAAGTKCILVLTPASGWATNCWAAGNGLPGDSCAVSQACAPGTDCLPVPTSPGTSMCMEYCDAERPACPSGATCTPLPQATIGSTTYGYCLPD